MPGWKCFETQTGEILRSLRLLAGDALRGTLPLDPFRRNTYKSLQCMTLLQYHHLNNITAQLLPPPGLRSHLHRLSCTLHLGDIVSEHIASMHALSTASGGL